MIDFNNDVMPLKNKFYRLALRIVADHAEAEDITQETLIRLWTRCETLSTAMEAEMLGLTISRNLSLDALSRAGRNYQQIDQESENYVSDEGATVIDALSVKDRHNFLLQITGTLPEKQRSVVQLRDIEGKTYREIAQVMQLSEEQVKVTLFRARQSLKDACKKNNNYGL